MNSEPRRPGVLALLALLFAGWIGWLAYLAYHTTQPIVLARPQFLISQIDVVAELHGDSGPAPTVKVSEVLYSTGKQHLAAGSEIEIANLAHLRPAEGWRGEGQYILPLMKDAEGKHRLAPIPRSPGYGGGSPRIYPLTPETREQHRQIREGPDSEQIIFWSVIHVLLAFVVVMVSASVLVAVLLLLTLFRALW